MDKIETTHMGTRRHSFVGKKGDLRVELHYVDLTHIRRHEHCGREAALYVFKERAPKNGVLLPMCQMWAYLPREMGKKPSVDAIAMGNRVSANAKAMALALYGVESQSDEFRVLDLLCDYLEDLKNHKPETGLDKTLDEFLAECDEEDTPFFFEVNGERIVG